MRRPDDEFIDLDDLEILRKEIVPTPNHEEGSIEKLVTIEGKGRPVDDTDKVLYMHETRFDNGQIVDLDERRRVLDKFSMNDYRYHDFIRLAFLTMKSGETAWIKLNESQHQSMYHQSYTKCLRRTQEEKDKIASSIGNTIYMKLMIDSIKREPKIPKQNGSMPEKVEFYEKIREIAKEQIEQKDYSNAKQLYSRACTLFRHMSREQKENLSENELLQRDEIMKTLFTNMSLCSYKKG